MKWIFAATLFALVSITVVTNHDVVFADDEEEEYEYHDRKEKEGDEGLEEIGEVVGWGSVLVLGAAGLIFPARRLTKTVISTLPTIKKRYIR